MSCTVHVACFFVFQIMEELANNGVNIYRFPVDDETVAEMNTSMNVSTVCLSVFWHDWFAATQNVPILVRS